MKPLYQQIFEDFKQVLREHYGKRLAKIILFGSYARGDFSADSDIDFLIVLKDKKVATFKEIKQLVQLKHPLILKYNIDISSIPISLDRFEHSKSPLLYFVRKEGVEL